MRGGVRALIPWVGLPCPKAGLPFPPGVFTFSFGFVYVFQKQRVSRVLARRLYLRISSALPASDEKPAWIILSLGKFLGISSFLEGSIKDVGVYRRCMLKGWPCVVW